MKQAQSSASARASTREFKLQLSFHVCRTLRLSILSLLQVCMESRQLERADAAANKQALKLCGILWIYVLKASLGRDGMQRKGLDGF